MTGRLWRVIKSTRAIGPRWILQRGIWMAPSTVGCSKGVKRRFVVDYEEFHATRALAEAARDGVARVASSVMRIL